MSWFELPIRPNLSKGLLTMAVVLLAVSVGCGECDGCVTVWQVLDSFSPDQTNFDARQTIVLIAQAELIGVNLQNAFGFSLRPETAMPAQPISGRIQSLVLGPSGPEGIGGVVSAGVRSGGIAELRYPEGMNASTPARRRFAA